MSPYDFPHRCPDTPLNGVMTPLPLGTEIRPLLRNTVPHVENAPRSFPTNCCENGLGDNPERLGRSQVDLVRKLHNYQLPAAGLGCEIVVLISGELRQLGGSFTASSSGSAGRFSQSHRILVARTRIIPNCQVSGRVRNDAKCGVCTLKPKRS